MGQKKRKYETRATGVYGARRKRQTADGLGGAKIEFDPFSERVYYGKQIRDALDPVKAPSKVRMLKDMTPEERKAIEDKYRGEGP